MKNTISNAELRLPYKGAITDYGEVVEAIADNRYYNPHNPRSSSAVVAP